MQRTIRLLYQPISQTIMDSKKIVSELLAMAAQPGVDENTYIVVAKIDCIYPHTGWCYVTCSSCSKKIHSVGGLFLCTICNAPSRYPMVRYSINLCVSDSNDPTSRAMFTIFNRHAERLLDSAANKFFNRLNPDQFPPPLLALVGRHFAFKIRLPDYANRDSDFHNFRVVAMYEVDPPLADMRCAFVHTNVAGPSKGSGPDVKCPFKQVEAIEAGGSTSQGDAEMGVTTPHKTCDRKKKRKVAIHISRHRKSYSDTVGRSDNGALATPERTSIGPTSLRPACGADA